MAEVNWTKQKKVWKEIGGTIRQAMTYISRELELGEPDDWDYDNDIGYMLFAVRKDGKSAHISFKLIDSGDWDTGVYGKQGNIQIDVVDDDGRILGGWTPYNYTDKVWVDYDDIEEFEDRVQLIANQWLGIVELVRQWKEEIENE